MKKSTIKPPVILSPYAHRDTGDGRACVQDCPACRWAAEFAQQYPELAAPSHPSLAAEASFAGGEVHSDAHPAGTQRSRYAAGQDRRALNTGPEPDTDSALRSRD